MSENTIREKSFKKSLFSGSMDTGGMENVLELYRDLYPVSEGGFGRAGRARELREDEVRMRLEEGFTLIELSDILPPADDLAERARKVVEVLAAHSEDGAKVSASMAAVLDDPASLRDLAAAYVEKGEEALREKVSRIEGVNPEVVLFVLFNSLKGAFLAAAARFLEAGSGTWEEGRCPVCGGEPSVAYTIGEGGKRHLVCHRCETHWRFRRLTCPFCGHENPRESGYLFTEEAEHQAMVGNVCGECGSYIKSWRIEGDDMGDLHPEVEDLKTPGFDKAVEEQGFHRGAPNIFGIWIGTIDEEGSPEKV